MSSGYPVIPKDILSPAPQPGSPGTVQHRDRRAEWALFAAAWVAGRRGSDIDENARGAVAVADALQAEADKRFGGSR